MSQDTTCISFVNSKGGTGKTTSCLSIAGCLAKDGKKVLVVDFDPRADAKNEWEIFHPETDAFHWSSVKRKIMLNDTNSHDSAKTDE